MYNAFEILLHKLKTPKVLNQSQASQCLFSREKRLSHSQHGILVCLFSVNKLTILGLSFRTTQVIKRLLYKNVEKTELLCTAGEIAN